MGAHLAAAGGDTKRAPHQADHGIRDANRLSHGRQVQSGPRQVQREHLQTVCCVRAVLRSGWKAEGHGSARCNMPDSGRRKANTHQHITPRISDSDQLPERPIWASLRGRPMHASLSTDALLTDIDLHQDLSPA